MTESLKARIASLPSQIEVVGESALVGIGGGAHVRVAMERYQGKKPELTLRIMRECEGNPGVLEPQLTSVRVPVVCIGALAEALATVQVSAQTEGLIRTATVKRYGRTGSR